MFQVRCSTVLQCARHQLHYQKYRKFTVRAGRHNSGKSSSSVVDGSGSDSQQSGGRNGTAVGAAVGQKLPKRAPLVKNFFIGEVDKELLGYPEVLTRDDMKKLEEQVIPLKNYFTLELHDGGRNPNASVSDQQVLDNLRQLGLYSINVPEDYDGKGWNWSGSLMASEPESKCTEIALSLLSHRTIIDGIMELGTDEQKKRFLPRLSAGSLVGAEAIFEYSAPEEDFFNTHAYHNIEGNSWSITGEKAFVFTGPLAKDSSLLLLVIAQTSNPQLRGDDARATTLFLIDAANANAANFELGEVHQTIGCRGLELRRIKFNQLVVSGDCVLGSPHNGNVGADVVLRSSRLRRAMVALELSKSILNELTDYCINHKQCGVLLKDMEIMHTHLSRATCNIYATESMLYLTAGLIDEFDGQDVSLEAAVTKYFALNCLYELATKMTHIIGAKSLIEGEASEALYRDALNLYTQGESIDTLCLFNALTGLQYAGSRIQDSVRMARNPLFHPGHIFSKILQNSNIDNPRSKMKLGENVHPSLEPAAQCIEHSVVRLQMCAELLLTRYGSAVVERHNEMHRLSNMVSLIYSMFASASRASRSYCIGLQNADYEMLLASAVCLNGRDVVKNLSTDIFNGHYANNDNNLRRLSKEVVKTKGYFPVHPLTFNF